MSDTVTFTWDDQEWTIPASWDHLSIDALDAFSELIAAGQDGDSGIVSFRHLTSFLSEVLGPQQWARMKRGRTAANLDGVVSAILGAFGEEHPGE